MAALPVLCIGVAVATLLWVSDGPAGFFPVGSGGAGAQGEGRAGDPDGSLSSKVMEVIAGAGEAMEGAAASSPQVFLGDLEAAGRHGGPCSAVRWSAEGDLVEPVQDVLSAYSGIEGTRLMSSGYLDLSGNVWTALLQGGKEWVDMVYASTDEMRSKTDVRVVRLWAGVQGRGEDR